MKKGVRNKTAFDSWESRLKKSTSIAQVKNTDNMCMARAIVIGKAKTDKNPRICIH